MQSAEASDLTTGTRPADPPLVAVDGEHHLGDAVTAGLRCEAVDKRAVEQAAHDRNDEHHVGAEQRQMGVGEVPQVARVGVTAEQLREGEDQVAKDDCSETRSGPDQEGERNQKARLPTQDGSQVSARRIASAEPHPAHETACHS